MIRDIRVGLRALARNRAFTAIAVVALALGIGLSTTALALIEAVRRPYVPYAQPDELYVITPVIRGAVRPGMWHAMVGGLSDLPAVTPSTAPYVGTPAVVRANNVFADGSAVQVAANFFAQLRVLPEAGRVFAPGERPTSRGTPVVISYHLWSDGFGRNPALPQLTVWLDDTQHPVVGVMPPTFAFPAATDVWELMPSAPRAFLAQMDRSASAIIRLDAHQSPTRVAAAFETVRQRVAREFAGTDAAFQFAVTPIRPEPQPLLGLHYLMIAAALLVLCVASLNVGALLLTRTTTRRREFAIRMAVGAPVGSIVRLVAVESVIIAVIGGLCGLVVASWTIHLAAYHMPAAVTGLGFLAPHFDVETAAIVMSLTTAALFLASIAPALRARDTQASEALKDGEIGRAHV